MRLAHCVVVCLTVCAATADAPAADATWNGTTDAQWVVGTNWSAVPVPGAGDTATFNNAGNGFTTIDLGLSGVTVKTLLFDTAGAAAYTIGGGTVGSQSLTLDAGGAITMNAAVANNQLVNAALLLGDGSAGSFTIANSSTTNSLTLAGAVGGGSGGSPDVQTLTVTGAGNTTFGGVLADGGAFSLKFVKSGATGAGGTGKVFLDANNTFTGGSTLGNATANVSRTDTATANSGGFVMLGHSNALGTGTITMKGAQVRATVAGLTIPNSIVLDGGAMRFGGSIDLAFSGNISVVGAARTIGNYSEGKTLTLGNILTDDGATPRNITFEATDGNAGNGTIVVDGIISGGGVVTLQNNFDNGFLYLNNAANSFTAKPAIKGGTLVVSAIGNAGSNSPLGTNGTIDLFAGSGATLRYVGGGETTDKVINLAGGDANGNATIEANNASGLLKFTADMTNAGTQSKVFRIRGTGNAEFAGKIVDNSATNKTSLLKIDEGSWTLSGNNAFSGGATLGAGAPANISTTGVATSGSAGFVILAHNNALGTGTVVVKGAQLRAGVAGLTIPNAFTLDAGSLRFGGNNDLELSGALTVGGGGDIGVYTTNKLTISGSLAIPSGKTVNFRGDSGVAGNVLISGTVTGVGALSLNADYNANGTVTLAGANDYSGNTSVNSGTLVLAHTLALQNTTLTTGRIAFDSSVASHAFTLGGLSGSGAISLQDNAGTPNPVALSVGNSNANTTYSGAFSGSGSLSKIGSGKLTLSGTNVHTGGTAVLAGTLAFGAEANLGAGDLTIANGAALQATAPFSSSRNLTLGAGGGTVDTNGFSLTLTGAVGDGGTNQVLTKTGAGTLALVGPVTYGASAQGVSTAVNGGVLSFTSFSPIPGWNQAGRYTVAAGAVLAVDASLTEGDVQTMLATGNFAPGAMAGFDTGAAARVVGGSLTLGAGTGLVRAGANDLTLAGNITLNAPGSTIGGAPGVAGTTYVAGTLSGTSGVTFGGGGTTQITGDNSAALSGTVILTGATSFTAAGAFGAGTLQIGAAVADPQVAITPSGNGSPMTLANNIEVRTTRFVVDAGTVGGIPAASSLTLGGNVTLNQSPARGGDITLQQGLPVVISGSIGGSSGLTTRGTGVLVLTGTNGYFYGTSLTAGDYGILSVASAASLPGYNVPGGPGAGSTMSTGGAAVGGNQSLTVGNAFTDAEIATLLANAQFAAGGRFGFDTGIGGAGPRTYGNAIADTPGGALDLRIVGNDTLTLTAASTYTGATVVGDDLNYSANTNKLALSGAGSLPVGTAVTVRVGALDVGTTTQTIGTLRFGGGYPGTTSAATIDAGGFLSLGGDVTYDAARNPNGAVVSGAGTLALNGNRSFVVGDSTGTVTELTIGATIADGSAVSSLTKTGLGTLALNGNNTFSGGAVLGNATTNNSRSDTPSSGSGGFVVLGHNNALGDAFGTITMKGAQVRAGTTGLNVPNPIIIDAGGFRFGGLNDIEFSGNILLVGADRGVGNYTDGTTLTLSGNIDLNGFGFNFDGDNGLLHGTVVVNGSIFGAGAVTVKDTFDNGTVWLNAANSHTGGTTVQAGTLKVGPGGTLGAATGALTLSGGQLDLGGTTQTVGAVSITAAAASGETLFNGTLNGTSFAVSGGGNNVVSAVLGGSGAVLTKTGLGKLELKVANTFDGGAVLGTGTTNNSTTDTASANSGGFVVPWHNDAFGTGTITVKGSQFRAPVPGLVIPNPISIDAGAFRFGGPDGLPETYYDMTFTGAMAVVGGNREIGNYSGNKTLTLGSIDVPGGWNLTFKGVEGGPNGTTIVAGGITGDGAVVVAGDYDNGIVRFNAAGSYAGATTANTGTLVLGDKNALGLSTLTMTGGARLEAGVAGLVGIDAVPNALTLTGNATVGGAEALEISGPVGNSGNDRTLTLSGGDKTLSGDIVYSGNGLRITTQVAGTTTLSGFGKTLRRLDVDGGAGSVVDIGAGNLALVNGGSNTLQSATGGTVNASGGGAIVLDIGTGTNYGDIGTADGTLLTINARITGDSFESWPAAAGTGTGVMVLANSANDFINCRINKGVVSVAAIGNQFDPASPLGQATIVDLAASNNATLRYTGPGETTDKMINLHVGAGTATIEAENPTGVLKFTNNLLVGAATSKTLQLGGSGNGEFAGVVPDYDATNKTSVTKSGTGTWKLTGAYSYTGNTTVDAGTLEVGTLNSTASTTVSGTLIADSIVQDTLTINAGGAVIIRETPVAGGASAVPEPSTLALLLAGALGLLALARRRK